MKLFKIIFIIYYNNNIYYIFTYVFYSLQAMILVYNTLKLMTQPKNNFYRITTEQNQIVNEHIIIINKSKCHQ